MSEHSDDGASWFGVSDDATRATAEAAIRGALVAQRDRLTVLWLDVLSDEAWPADARPVVRLAEDRLERRRRRGISLTLDPHVDEDFEIALALAPFTIGSTGMSDRGHHLWDVNDTGTSASFLLTAVEESTVRSAIARAGGRADDLVTLSQHRLGRLKVSDDVVGGTAPGTDRWRPPAVWRAVERSVRLGSGTGLWDEVSEAVLSWGVKTRSGFTVDPPLDPGRHAQPGDRLWLVAHIGPVRVREPVEVVATVADDHRVALAYGTLEGHPVTGEEAFIVHRDDDGTVTLTLRSLTRAGRRLWKPFFPVALVAQHVYRRRYLRVLRQGSTRAT